MGGSAFKLVYVSKDTWKEKSQRDEGSKGMLHLVSFSRENIDEALDFIKTKAKVLRNVPEETVQVFTTGSGGLQYTDRLCQELNVKNSILTEFDCFIQGFLYAIKNIPMKDEIYPPNKGAHEFIQKEMQTQMETFTHAKAVCKGFTRVDFDRMEKAAKLPENGATDLDKPFSLNSDLFPCLVVMIGSAVAIYLVYEDGSFVLCDGNIRGGRMFLGLGSLLTQADSYSELVDLCTRGDAGQVTQTSRSLANMMSSDSKSVREGSADIKDSYTDFVKRNKDSPEERPFFAFGHAYKKRIDDFKREDLARCLLETMASDITGATHGCAVNKGVKHVFFTGGLVAHDVVREALMVEWLRRESLVGSLDPGQNADIVRAHFMVHAHSFGAIGAFLNHKYSWNDSCSDN